MARLFAYVLFFFALSSNALAKVSNVKDQKKIALAVETSNRTRGATTFWRSDDLGLIFGYDDRWKPANPSQQSTVAVINWLSNKSGNLMASCYLEINNHSDISRLRTEDIGRQAKYIVDSYLRNGRLRDPNMKIVKWYHTSIDNYPVVYIERDMTINIFDTVNCIRVYSIVTSWKGREVNFECASSIPIDMPEMAGIVEGPIKKILGSLQFVRESK